MLFSVNKYVAESSRLEKDKMWGSDWSDLMASGLILGPEGHAGFRQVQCHEKLRGRFHAEGTPSGTSCPPLHTQCPSRLPWPGSAFQIHRQISPLYLPCSQLGEALTPADLACLIHSRLSAGRLGRRCCRQFRGLEV